MVKKANRKLAWKYLPLALSGFYDYHMKIHFSKILPPKSLIFPITYRCDSRCVMCSIWEKKPRQEMSLDELERAFSDNLFRRIQNVNITGGEPTLRKDLSDLVYKDQFLRTYPQAYRENLIYEPQPKSYLFQRSAAPQY